MYSIPHQKSFIDLIFGWLTVCVLCNSPVWRDVACDCVTILVHTTHRCGWIESLMSERVREREMLWDDFHFSFRVSVCVCCLFLCVQTNVYCVYHRAPVSNSITCFLKIFAHNRSNRDGRADRSDTVEKRNIFIYYKHISIRIHILCSWIKMLVWHFYFFFFFLTLSVLRLCFSL